MHSVIFLILLSPNLDNFVGTKRFNYRFCTWMPLANVTCDDYISTPVYLTSQNLSHDGSTYIITHCFVTISCKICVTGTDINILYLWLRVRLLIYEIQGSFWSHLIVYRTKLSDSGYDVTKLAVRHRIWGKKHPCKCNRSAFAYTLCFIRNSLLWFSNSHPKNVTYSIGRKMCNYFDHSFWGKV